MTAGDGMEYHQPVRRMRTFFIIWFGQLVSLAGRAGR
jgi:hypothetical protein